MKKLPYHEIYHHSGMTERLENFEKYLDKNKKLLEKFNNISTRARNSLRDFFSRYNFDIENLFAINHQITDADILRIRNCGRNTLPEVKGFLRNIVNYQLEMINEPFKEIVKLKNEISYLKQRNLISENFQLSKISEEIDELKKENLKLRNIIDHSNQIKNINF